MKQNLLKFSFFLLGVFSVVSQSSLFRELVSVFFGNEFFSALILGFWLFWVTIGSLFLSKFFKEKKEILPIFFILISILLLFEIFFLRFFKFFSKIPGEIPNLTLALFLAFFATAPLCSLLGIFWKIASKIFAQTESPRSATNFAYFLEVLGFFVGGILFSFFLFWFSAFQVAIFLLILAFFFFSFWLKKPFKKILILALSFCLVFVF
ncbi:hypothetical protein H5T58_02560, partial [Candidatus Parcubacteria bacterium]|nr:hypothetical protein [Candidatus Parcubacteria bacterium]